jgi:DNA repair exonuclease SbcCD ATPase subunit
MTPMKSAVRATIDRFVKTYFDRLTDDVRDMRAEMAGLLSSFATASGETRAELESFGASTRWALDELRSQLDEVRSQADEVRSQLGEVRSQLGEVRSQLGEVEARVAGEGASALARAEEAERARAEQEARSEAFAEAKASQLEQRFAEVEAKVVYHLEGQAQRQAELREAMDNHARAMKEAMERLELLFLQQLEGLFRAVHDESANMRRDIAELTRMIRMQGDAQDEVAEVMGRTLTRLSAEVEALGLALDAIRESPEAAPSPA